MDIKDSSDDEETQNISAFSKFDESIEVRNAEEIKSPVNTRSAALRKNSKNFASDSFTNLEIGSPRGKPELRRYSAKLEHGNTFGKSIGIGSDPSDSEESDDDDIRGTSVTKNIDFYDPKKFDDLQVSTEVKELFQNIMRYTPQKINLDYKLIPFIPDYIPAVGDIDAFIKISRPDGATDKVGLVVLDEPCANQSEPAVLHLQLRSQSKSAGTAKQVVIKRIEDAEKNGKSIDKWIEDMNQLQRSRHSPAVQLSKPVPDIDTLMQQWPPELEEKLNDMQLDLSKLDCDLPHLVDIVCNLVDIPVHEDARLEALHTLFTLFLEVRDNKY